MRLLSLVSGVLMAPVLWGQIPGRVRYIPALAYGPSVWSIVRLTNSGSKPQSARVEAYREDGTALPLAPVYKIEPGATLDVRIDGKTASDEMSWALVVLPEGVSARGFVEILQGDALEDFPREPHELSGEARWVTLATRVQGKQMYFLNAGDQPTMVTFCAAESAPPHACEKKGIRAARYRVGRNQSLSVQVHKLRGKFFITESSMPEAAVLALFDNGPGAKRVFGANSSIEFGEPQPQR